ncbi:MAG: hypothetical protein NTX86_00905 [Candidatus Dependentiae bacterium]|nr:hypothetical protein [Candidatus Dependentiae bacterium]
MNKNIKTILAVTLLASLTGTASAFFNFGFSTGTRYHYVEPVRHCFYEPQPQLNFGFGGRNGGVAFSIPLAEPKRVVRPVTVVRPMVMQPVIVEDIELDNHDKTYWRVHNDTDQTIEFVNYRNESTRIRPGRNEAVSHKRSFKFTVYADGQKYKGTWSRHTMRIKADFMDNIYFA